MVHKCSLPSLHIKRPQSKESVLNLTEISDFQEVIISAAGFFREKELFKWESSHPRTFWLFIPAQGNSLADTLQLPPRYCESLRHISTNPLTWLIASNILFMKSYSTKPNLEAGIHPPIYKHFCYNFF